MAKSPLVLVGETARQDATLHAGSVRAEPVANRLLLASPEALARLTPRLEFVNLRRTHVLYEAEARIRHVDFVNRGLVSLVKTMRDGRTVEIGTIGVDGVVGLSALFDVNTALFEKIVQVPGNAYRISVADVKREMADNRRFHDLLEGYVHVAMSQIAQTAACNRLHSLEERCCRWLLTSHDAARANEFLLTQEFLAMMLGARRVSVSIAASGLQKQGFIRYRRGRLSILNRAGIEALACECYATVKVHADRLFAGRLTV